ncbi:MULTISPECIES: hypothetical protein [Cyanophyceae]|uniref:hypothetical protein n=1 Tax=Cyanophyceae TaxID=3028117 RepID=UPI0016858528|nr:MULTISPECIES: hypothetical protein [Cyanophyceae]MBD1918902.1 hypothetical protein [Phormidium sp. FACHB-77]MBD2033256.1 hypothetical protein [Phormidium sp. FACHB-322]MBD2053811.1 hypothetical protein [Leptolyngbya sp. FACHB-60]
MKERHIITIGIDPIVYEALKEHSDTTGIQIKRLASTAIAKWLREEHGIDIQYPRPRSTALRRATDKVPTPTTAA